MKIKITAILLLITVATSYSQEKIDLNDLHKEWKLETLEKNGKIKNAEEFDKNESIIFYKNNKFKMNDSEHTMNGVWHFNYATNILELKLIEINQTIKLKLLSLKPDELNYVAVNDEENIIFHFKPKQITKN